MRKINTINLKLSDFAPYGGANNYQKRNFLYAPQNLSESFQQATNSLILIGTNLIYNVIITVGVYAGFLKGLELLIVFRIFYKVLLSFFLLML